MTLQEIRQWNDKTRELLRQQRVHEAIEHIGLNASERFQPRIDEIKFTYENILTYVGKGVIDPMENTIYSKLMVSIYELCDQINLFLLSSSGSKIAALKADVDKQSARENEDLTENLIGLAFDKELNELIRDAFLFDDESESETARSHRQAISRAFHKLWLTDKLTENDERDISELFNSPSIPWFEKAMLVSALTLGTLRVFDSRRISILFDLYENPDAQISQRALFGCIVSMLVYDKRFYYYQSLMDKIARLENRQEFIDDTLNLIIQFNRSKDTERVTRKLQDEILPSVIKFNEDLNEKLDLDKLIQSGESLDKNPDWESYFDSQPGLMRKLEELTNMQLEGVDVFLSAFAMLKSFPFFHELPNWFMPFYPENYAVQQSLHEEGENFKNLFLKGLDLSVYMCNSDKFSFVFNIKHMPEQQKNLMIQMFEGEGEQLVELKNEELSDPALGKKRIIIQYIQDLYRFFKLHSLHNELGDLFQQPFNVHKSAILTGVIQNAGFYKSVANFFFDNNHFPEAFDLYEYLIEQGENYPELYEKAGFCKQQLGSYHEAIRHYKRADLFDTNHAWLLRKQAQCYLALENIDDALRIFLELSELEPENQRVNASIGTCYLDLGKPDQAIEYFYRIEFANPGSSSAIRPVAWSLFLLNNLDEANRYYEQLLDAEPNTFDFMNAGHVAFSLKDKKKAVSHYLDSIRSRNNDIRSFIKSYNKDRKYLLANGVEASEIALMLDYLRFGNQK